MVALKIRIKFLVENDVVKNETTGLEKLFQQRETCYIPFACFIGIFLNHEHFTID